MSKITPTPGDAMHLDVQEKNFQSNTLRISLRALEGRNWLVLQFPYNQALMDSIRKLPQRKWIGASKAWIIPDDKIGRDFIQSIVGWEIQFDQTAPVEKKIITGQIPEEMSASGVEALSKLERHIHLLNYSKQTLRNYRSYFIQFLLHFNDKIPQEVSHTEILDYLLKKKQANKWSSSAQNSHINAIKFYYEHICKREERFYEIPRAQKPEALPKVLSIQEMSKMIEMTENLKHKTILCYLYAGGLRLSELCSLRTIEIDTDRMLIHIRNGKGQKDRQVMLSPLLKELTAHYVEVYKPKDYLFEGSNTPMYSPRSVQQIVKQAAKRAGIDKQVTPHHLRHSFATHLLEGGTDLISIQKLLGHNSLRTTAIYTQVSSAHISKISSPLDKLGLNLGTTKK